MANNSVKEIICYLVKRSTSSRPKRLNEIERKKTEEATTFAITHALKIPKKLADSHIVKEFFCGICLGPFIPGIVLSPLGGITR